VRIGRSFTFSTHGSDVPFLSFAVNPSHLITLTLKIDSGCSPSNGFVLPRAANARTSPPTDPPTPAVPRVGVEVSFERIPDTDASIPSCSTTRDRVPFPEAGESPRFIDRPIFRGLDASLRRRGCERGGATTGVRSPAVVLGGGGGGGGGSVGGAMIARWFGLECCSSDMDGSRGHGLGGLRGKGSNVLRILAQHALSRVFLLSRRVHQSILGGKG
jgi:hypothetical protein